MATVPRVTTPPRPRPTLVPAAAPRAVIVTDSLYTPVHRDSSFFIYLVLAVIVFIVVWVLQNNAQKSGFLDSLRKPGNAINPALMFIFWAIVLLILVYATSVGSRTLNGQHRMWINVAFGLNLLLVLLAAVFFYQQRNLSLVFWTVVALFFVTLWLAYLVYQVNRMAGLLLIIYLVWLVYVGWNQWQLVQANPNRPLVQ